MTGLGKIVEQLSVAFSAVLNSELLYQESLIYLAGLKVYGEENRFTFYPRPLLSSKCNSHSFNFKFVYICC